MTATAHAPRRRRGFLNFWDAHPAIPKRHELTLGEKAADDMRNLMGSWPFVFGALVFLGAWIAVNAHDGAFDPFPFILLNLMLSCVAALQGAILLIAAKRADQISSMLAQHDYETNVTALKKIESLEKHVLEVGEQNQRILKHLETR